MERLSTTVYRDMEADQPDLEPPGRYATAIPGLVWSSSRGDVTIISAIEDEWDNLCAGAGFPSAILRPALIRAYLGSFAPNARIRLITARRGTQLAAVLPLVERSFGRGRLDFTWMHSAGNLHIPGFDLIHAEEDPGAVALELWQFLQDMDCWDVLQVDSVPGGGILDRVRLLALGCGVATHLHRPENAPYIEIPASPTVDDLAGSQRKQLRKHLRRDHRRVRELGTLSHVEAGRDHDYHVLAECLERFLELEHATWKGTAGTSILSHPATADFYRRLFSEPDLRGRFRVFLLSCGEDLIAADIGMVAGSTFYALKTAFNEAYREYSPGHLSLLYVTHALGMRGFKVHDLGGAADAYKLSWTSLTRPHGTVFLFRPGRRGRMIHALMFRLAPWVKQRLGNKPLPRIARRMMD